MESWRVGMAIALVVTLGLRDTVVRGISAPAATPTREARSWAAQLGGPFRTISGNVQTVAGRGMAGARVEAVLVLEGLTYPMAIAQTSQGGGFSFGELPEGSYWLIARRNGFARASRVVRLHGADENGVLLSLGPSATISGRIEIESASGEPSGSIRGVIVRASPDGGGEGPPFAVRTRDDGAFELADLPAGTYRVEVGEPGYEPVVRRAIPAPSRGMILPLRALASVTGVVRDTAGRPVVGAEVTFAGSGVWPARSTRSLAAGHFEIINVPGGVYELRARDHDDVAEPIAPLNLAPGARRDVTLVLAPGASVQGVVVDAESNRPIAGARVMLTEDAIATSPTAVRCNERGEFRANGLLRRVHQVSAAAPGYVTRLGVLASPGGESVRVGLDREVVLTGRVVDTRGAPVAGAQIEVISTDLDGRPTALSAAGVAFRERLFAAQSAGPQPLIRSGELGVMPGPIPVVPLVAGAAPQAHLIDAPSAPTGFVSDAAGRFRITAVPPGLLSVAAQHPAYVRAETTQRAVGAGITTDVEIVLHPGGTIDGRIVDERGFPLAAQLIEARTGHDAFPRRVFSQRDGTFRIPSVLGRVAVVALIGGRPLARTEADVADDAIVPVLLTLDRNVRRIRGRVTDEHAFPIAGVELTMSSETGGGGSTRTISLADGTFETMIAGTGAVQIDARHPRYSLRSMRAREVDADVSIVLSEGGDLVVRVRADGCVSGDVAIEIRTPCGPIRRVARAAMPLRIEHVCAGRVQIVAQAPGCVAGSVSATVVAGRTVEPPAVELGAGGGASGEVVDGRNQPVPGALVSLPDTPSDAVSGTAQSNRRGQFDLRDLPDGDHTLVATHPLLGRSRPAPVRVFHGSIARGVRLEFARALADATAERDRSNLGLADRAGDVVVTTVPRDGPAYRAGLQSGDVIATVNARRPTNAAEASRLLDVPLGDDVTLHVRRDGFERTLRWTREP